MEPLGATKTEPSTSLLNEIKTLVTHTGLIELYLKQAEAATTKEIARLHRCYESALADLRIQLKEKQRALADLQETLSVAEGRLEVQFQQLTAEIAEKQRIIDHCQSERSQTDGEIESLRARLSELRSANEVFAARSQEAESARDSLRTELALLDDLLREKSHEMERHQEAAREHERELNDRGRELERRLSENRSLLTTNENDLQRAQAEIVQLRESNAALAASRTEAEARMARELEQTRIGFEARLAEMQTALGENERALNERHAAMMEIQNGLKVRIHDLKNQLEQAQSLLESRDGDLAELQAQLAESRARNGELEQTYREALIAAGEVDAVRQNFATEIQELRCQLHRNQGAVQESRSTAGAPEESFQSEIRELQIGLEQGDGLLEVGTNELRNARSYIAGLERRILNMDVNAGELQQLARREIEQARVGFEGRLKELEDLLAKKDEALQACAATIIEIDSNQEAQIADMGSQLARQQALLASRDGELAALRSGLDAKEQSLTDQRASLSALEAAHRALKGELEAQLAQSRDLLKSKDSEVELVRSEQAALREQIAADHAAEIALLRGELRTETERSAAEQARANDVEAKLRTQIDDLEERLTNAHRLLERREECFNTARLEFSASLEQKEQALGILQSRAAGLETTLNAKIQELRARLAEREAQASELARRQEAQTTELRERLAATQHQLEQRQQALDSAKFAAAELEHRLAHLEASDREAQAVAQEMGRKQEALESTLTDLKKELQKKESELTECRATIESMAQMHKNEIQTTEATLAEFRRAAMQEQQRQLESRVDQPARVKAAMASLPEPLGPPKKMAQDAAGETQDREMLPARRCLAVNSSANELMIPDKREENALVLRGPRVSVSQREHFDKLKDLLEKVQTEESPAFPARVGWRQRYFGTWKRRKKT